MKNITDRINEGRELKIPCAFNDLVDEEGIPVHCTLVVDAKYASQVSKFGKDEEGNIFAHFCDDADVCY